MLYFLFAERPLTALIAVNIQLPCYVTNAEYYVTDIFHQGITKASELYNYYNGKTFLWYHYQR